MLDDLESGLQSKVTGSDSDQWVRISRKLLGCRHERDEIVVVADSAERLRRPQDLEGLRVWGHQCDTCRVRSGIGT